MIMEKGGDACNRHIVFFSPPTPARKLGQVFQLHSAGQPGAKCVPDKLLRQHIEIDL